MAIYTQHLPQWKKDEVEAIKGKATSHALFGFVDMYGIPATQLQQIRKNLRGIADVKMTRNSLIEHALNELGGDIGALRDHISGQSALIFTDENPFKLFKRLENTKTKMAAKPGETAPEDIVVSKGPTGFKPGPIVGELQMVGIPAAIEGGKVVIRETKTVVKKGEAITPKLAGALVKLEIKPMDIGLILQVAFYDGAIFEPGMLAIDETAFFDNLVLATTQAINLSVNAVYPTAATVTTIIAKAAGDARNLAVEAGVYEKGVIDLIIVRAYQRMLSLALAAAEHGLELDEAITMAAAAATAPAAPPAAEEPAGEEAEEETEEETEDEEGGMAGLGALFG